MNVLEKILEENEMEVIKELTEENERCFKQCEGACSSTKNGICNCNDGALVQAIQKIQSYLESTNNENDDWIPVSKRMPEPYKLVEVTVHCSEWISDYNSAWVPENEKIHYDEEYLSRTGYTDEGGDWLFYDKDGCEIYCDKEFGTDKTDVYNVVTAWQPLPEPYKGGE